MLIAKNKSMAIRVLAPAIALIVATPVIIIALSIFSSGSAEIWHHLLDTVLTDYVVNSVALMFGVGTLTLLIGVPPAWLVAVCEFPGRRIFAWALLLPLAFPAYIIAYTYTGVLEFSGPVQTWLRGLTDWQSGDYWFFQIRSLSGAIAMLSLVLYPYVYLLTRAALLERSTASFEVCRTLGYSHASIFFRVALPLTRPAIATGVSLALMETLADYGTVQYFNLSTFTTGIFRTYYGLDDLNAAFQLSAVLLTFVALLIFMERHSRRKIDYFAPDGQSLHEYRIQLRGRRAMLAWLCCAAPILLGFAIPALILLKWTVFDAQADLGNFLLLMWHSFYLAALAAVVAVSLALALSYSKRLQNTVSTRLSVGVAGLGYAIPGTIVAVGIIVPLAWLDHRMIDAVKQLTGHEVGLIFSGSIVALLFAYTVRFLAISLGTVQNGLDKIKPQLDDAARSLGRGSIEVMRSVHVPLMRSTVLTAFLIVFVDVLKELPATLILRPFNFNTLAVRAYELASDERLVDAALPSLTIVLIGAVPVVMLNRAISKSGWQSQ